MNDRVSHKKRSIYVKGNELDLSIDYGDRYKYDKIKEFNEVIGLKNLN